MSVRLRKNWLFGTDVVDGYCLLSVQDLEAKQGGGYQKCLGVIAGA